MQPQAAAQADVLLDMMSRICSKRLVANFLVDGSFGWNPSLPIKLLDMTKDREVTLVFYLHNGPSQRRYKDTLINGFYTRTKPEDFRKKIVSDGNVRAQYKALVERLRPVYEKAKAGGDRVIFMVGLEDNLTKKEANAMKALIKEVFPDANVGRNPCNGCYAGNDGDVSGFIAEAHTANANGWLPAGGIVTNDGQGDERTKLTPLKQRLASGSTAFIYWNRAAQGYSEPPRAADKRDYHIYSEQGQKEIVDWLNTVP